MLRQQWLEGSGELRNSVTEVLRIEHVQLAMPPGREADAREFYSGLLGIPEIPKPPELAKRGGAWFETGELKIHLGVEADFRPARKAHPALLVRGLRALVERLRRAQIDVVEDPLEGYYRVYIADPFGNRIELMESRSHSAPVLR
jgi:catechol 2,3-dioxygenase-like lactoylglutathione lyase family enzyme